MTGPAGPEPSGETSLSFEEARERLRSRGYLDRGVEGAVLKGALAARTRTRGVFRAAVVAALLLALALALAETAGLAASSALSLRDTAFLFGWLLSGGLLVASFLVGALGGAAWLRSRQRKDVSGVSTELAVAVGLLAGTFGAAAARPVLSAAGPFAAAAALAVVAGAVFLAVRVARGVAFTVLLASGRAVFSRAPRRGALLALLFALLALVAALLLAPRDASGPEEPLVVKATSRRVVVVAVDGWSDRYLDPSGAARERTALRLSGRSRRYVKDVRDPAAFWTTIATGESVRRHGVGSLDLIRVALVRAPVRISPGSGWLLGRLLPALHLARFESVTSAARRAPALWEVASRGGIPSLVVNWWTTYPAGEGSGIVLSNHLYFAARSGASLAGEGWPPEAAREAALLAPRPTARTDRATRLAADARGLDEFALRAFEQAFRASRPRLSLLYLPGLDILAAALSDPSYDVSDRIVLASALSEEALSLRAFLGSELLRRDVDLLAIVLDGGRSSDQGELLLEGPLASADGAATVRPADLAPTLLALLGVPSSREAEGRVDRGLVASGSVTDERVASWGRHHPPARLPVDAREYVENLRSLGYLK